MRHRVNIYFKLIIKKVNVLNKTNEIGEARTIDTKLDAFMVYSFV